MLFLSLNEGGASTWFVADSFGLLLLHAYYGFNQPTVSVISWGHVGQPTASQKGFDLIFKLLPLLPIYHLYFLADAKLQKLLLKSFKKKRQPSFILLDEARRVFGTPVASPVDRRHGSPRVPSRGGGPERLALPADGHRKKPGWLRLPTGGCVRFSCQKPAGVDAAGIGQ